MCFETGRRLSQSAAATNGLKLWDDPTRLRYRTRCGLGQPAVLQPSILFLTALLPAGARTILGRVHAPPWWLREWR